MTGPDQQDADTQGADPSALVVATKTGSLQQADVIRAVLASEGIPAIIADEGASNTLAHMGPAIHPWGVKVMVQAKHLTQALEIVERPAQGVSEDAPAKVGPSADEWARSAWRAAMFFWYFAPMALLALYNIIRALRACEHSPPKDVRQFNRRIGGAFILGVIVPAGLLALIIAGVLTPW